MLYKIKSESIGLITEKYRLEPGLKPRVSRLAYEHSATKLYTDLRSNSSNVRIPRDTNI